MVRPDPLISSFITRPAFQRLAGALVIIIVLWLAIAWAVALP